MRAFAVACGLAGMSLVAVLAFATTWRTPTQIPDHFTNLRLLPKDSTLATLVPIMKQFCFDLNVRCEHCHVGEGNDLSKFDFASDDRPAKTTARAMIAMLRTINDDLLKGVGQPSATPKVTCYTCHHGAVKPLTAAPARGSGGRDR